ncbi:MAG: radical SAM family heme chaperone HemW [Clostridia bacterium]|nr:radical SAM family heme chaperone HemW [Clostridia bacterium]
MTKKPMGLYIHIPFCNKKCDYCDFVSYSMDTLAQQDYLGALFAEIDMVKKDFFDETFDTIYIGGGTPSVVYEGFIASLVRKLFSSFHIARDYEFTIEVNPASFSEEKFFEYVEAGVNRISVGVQSINPGLLKVHGRNQSLSDVDKTFKILSNARFRNVSADVMIGLPKQSKKDIVDTVNYLIKQNVQHLSVYNLQIEKGTVTENKIRKQELKPVYEKKALKQYNEVYNLLRDNGYSRYELSNFARPAFKSRHNSKYWDNTEFLGLGVSAYSYVGNYRYYNTKRLDTYIEKINEGKLPRFEKQYISIKERRTERIMLSLRTVEGLDLEAFKQEFNEDLLQSKKHEINVMIKEGMVEIVDNFLRVTEKHFYITNSIIVELM